MPYRLWGGGHDPGRCVRGTAVPAGRKPDKKYESGAYLPVKAGDTLRIVERTSRGILCKRNGVSGWYFGRYKENEITEDRMSKQQVLI